MCPPGGPPRRCTPRAAQGAAPTMLNSAASLGKPTQSPELPRCHHGCHPRAASSRQLEEEAYGQATGDGTFAHFLQHSLISTPEEEVCIAAHISNAHVGAQKFTSMRPLDIDRGGMRPSSVRGAVCRRVTPRPAAPRIAPPLPATRRARQTAGHGSRACEPQFKLEWPGAQGCRGRPAVGREGEGAAKGRPP